MKSYSVFIVTDIAPVEQRFYPENPQILKIRIQTINMLRCNGDVGLPPLFTKLSESGFSGFDSCFGNGAERISRNPHLAFVSGNPLRSIPETTVHYFYRDMKGAKNQLE